ncbi:MAG: chromosomal replication initiator protein DnaA [Deltaproteobacteria bacterium]|nr:chromosomal replication initiator protein DnaA [Deltaproteobacteria bacterium]
MEKVTPNTYNIWFKQIRGAEVDGDHFVISVPNRFYADWFTDYYVELFERESSALAQRPLKLRFHILEAEEKENGSPDLQPPKGRPVIPVRTAHVLNPKYTFANFVVGSGNQLAHAAAQAVADLPGGHYNPLFLYGGVGLGKTHLLHAIAIEALQKHPELKLICLSAEKFMNEFIFSVRNNKMEAFRKKYRAGCDMLLIDDIQFLGGKDGTQEEFFHTFNELRESHRQLVLTGDKIPKEIPGLEERLRSRFEWGLSADIQPPDLETRVAILRNKAANDNIPLSDEVAMLLAQNIQSNVRELEGALIRLNAFAKLAHSKITPDLAKEMIHKHFSTQAAGGRHSSVESIQETVANFYQISSNELKSHRRMKTLAYPRQVAMYLCKKHLRLSFPEIGNRFGGKDHTTVLHACRKIRGLLEIDPNLQNDIAILEKTIV